MELRVVDRSTLLEAPEKILVAWLGEVKLEQNLQSFLLELAISSRSPANITRHRAFDSTLSRESREASASAELSTPPSYIPFSVYRRNWLLNTACC